MEAIKTVLYGAIGIRRKSDHERAQIRPVHIIAAAIVFVVLFIFILRTIVHMVTS
jgi:hypothetical protein